MRSLTIFLVSAVLCLLSFEIDAKPFFNPFNVAIKTGRTDEGHKISLLYPKKSYDVSVNVKSQTVNEHKFDFASLISSFTRFLPKPGQGFSFPHPFKKTTTTTTTEANDLFGDDDSLDGSSWSSSSDNGGDSPSTSFDDKPSTDDTKDDNESVIDNSSDDETSDDTGSSDSSSDKPGKKCNCKDEVASDSASGFSMESAKISYIPPKTVNEYFSQDSAATPDVNYLPPN